MLTLLRTLTLACLFLPGLSLNTLAGDDPEERQPSPDAPEHRVFRWTSKDGLRYTWVLPPEYDGERAFNLTVILHGTGLDYRWGHWNNKPGIFRPNDIVVSVDGPSPSGETRLFLGESKDAKAFKAFLDEMRTSFVIDRIFLYGHSQGGFFVVYFAGEFPKDVAGVVAHASGHWGWSKMGRDVKQVAIAFMHGTVDPVVPYRQSRHSRAAYDEAGFELLHLRRLQLYNHWPNAVRANEVIGWCDGMTTEDPASALAAAQEILRPKDPDEYQWQTVPGFSAAREILRRFESNGPAAFEGVEPKLAGKAAKWAEQIEKEGGKHVRALKKHVKKKKDLSLSDASWLGHLVALRDDFRGVDSVEAYIKQIGYETAVKAQDKSVKKIISTWYEEQDSKKLFETIVAEISKAFLFEGFPPELAQRMETLEAEAEDHELSRRALKLYADMEAWREGWKEGLSEYADIWKDWKGVGR